MSSETIESTRGIEFLAWLEINKKRLIAAGLVGALLLGGFALYRWRSAQLELEANSELVLLQSGRTRAGLPAAEVKAQDLAEFASRYGTTEAGKRGLLLAAGALFREGKYAESLASFESFRSGNVGSPLVDTAVLGGAACLEAMGKTDEAIAAYREVIANYPESASASQARLALAGLLETKNEFQQALSFYDQLGTTAWATEAGARRQALLASHPELAPAPTNSPVPELTLPGVAVPPAAEN
jgi:predicted negative regulator of RcsB-dependent stress response